MEGGGVTTVFVCDDSLGYPMLIRNWCEAYDGVDPAGVARSSEELLTMLPAAQPDVLLLDLRLGNEVASPELVESVRSLVPGVRVVLTSSMSDDVLASEAERIGADGCCSKLASADALFAAIAG